MEKQTKAGKELRSSNQKVEENLSYEKALEQLEEILDKMNGSVTLEESVALYERADKLLAYCTRKLGEAESKIETLVKNRAGEFALGQDGRPQIESSFDKSSNALSQGTKDSVEGEKGDLPF